MAKLIEYLTEKFLSHAPSSTKHYNYSLNTDSPSLQSLSTIQGGNVYTSDGNEHGEADYAIWYHCMHSPSNNLIIVSSNVDTWVYGLEICEAGHMNHKQVYVQRSNNNIYINMSRSLQKKRGEWSSCDKLCGHGHSTIPVFHHSIHCSSLPFHSMIKTPTAAGASFS